MYKSEIIRLGSKVQELKKSYEMVRIRRENHSLELNSLDNQIEDITKSLEELKIQKERNKRIKESISKDTKPAFIRGVASILITLIIRVILEFFLIGNIYKLTNCILQIILPLSSFCLSLNLLPNFILRIINCVNFNKISKEYNFLENKHGEIISKRILLGNKYKDIRESEVMAKNIYKETEKILSSKLAHLYNESDEYKPIDTRDIYHKIIVDQTYYQESIENQKEIIDNLLKNYLIQKIIESNFNKINLFVDDLSVEDLFLILLERIPKSNHHEVLCHIIHALLGISGNMQNYSIVWYEEDDEKYIKDPEIVFDEMNKWNQLKTHKDTSYEIIFKTVYDTFMNVFMREEQYKRKREKNKK